MFDEIDTAYFLTRAAEERSKAAELHGLGAERHRRLAQGYEARAAHLMGSSAPVKDLVDTLV